MVRALRPLRTSAADGAAIAAFPLAGALPWARSPDVPATRTAARARTMIARRLFMFPPLPYPVIDDVAFPEIGQDEIEGRGVDADELRRANALSPEPALEHETGHGRGREAGRPGHG